MTADPDHSWVATEDWDYLLEAFERRAGFTRRAGTQNKRPRRKRGDFLAKIDAIGRELMLEAETRAKLVKFAYERTQRPKLPPITKLEICNRAGTEDYDFSRAASDPLGESFNRIFNLMQDPDGLLQWWANHRRVHRKQRDYDPRRSSPHTFTSRAFDWAAAWIERDLCRDRTRAKRLWAARRVLIQRASWRRGPCPPPGPRRR